ncbi:hypothetical protein SDRG_05146 [Saprolegnia diclina VS20]|uniref:Uncharacterized protein n=1 Tax=Saprolegnia diclina (strain VS20) TaxID=1156394 RepID=T0S4E0_SAPDV|nr:hypothetical protein SDRG_05146 [Saprolegnia diclina VS20]EQC37547.1 hypothetical protein SDRG_05146 [Saprolegnia diclina VS20]|eukprot:XP_008609067.1 hypothetical protein SDRG_05146 [Saprolegnia diclina VS20]
MAGEHGTATRFVEGRSFVSSWNHLCSMVLNVYGHAAVVQALAAMSLAVLYLYVQGHAVVDLSVYDAVVVDHAIAGLGLSFPIGYVVLLNLYYSDVHDALGASLLLLRVTSCCIMGVALTIFLAEYFTRRILISLVLFGYGAWGFFYAWSVPIWRWYMYDVCEHGLMAYLPESLQTMLLQTTLLEWLTDTSFFDSMQKYLPFLMPLSLAEQQRVVRSLPADDQARLLKPGLLHLLPETVQETLLPETTSEHSGEIIVRHRPSSAVVAQSTPSYSFGFDFAAATTTPPKDDPTILADLINARVASTIQQVVALPSPKLVNRTAAISSCLFVFQLTRSAKARAQFFILCRVVLLSVLGTVACASVSVRCLQLLAALPRSSQRYLQYAQQLLLQQPSVLRLRHAKDSHGDDEDKHRSRWATVSKSVLAAVAIGYGLRKLQR